MMIENDLPMHLVFEDSNFYIVGYPSARRIEVSPGTRFNYGQRRIFAYHKDGTVVSWGNGKVLVPPNWILVDRRVPRDPSEPGSETIEANITVTPIDNNEPIINGQRVPENGIVHVHTRLIGTGIPGGPPGLLLQQNPAKAGQAPTFRQSSEQ